jgi:hypothetical protein
MSLAAELRDLRDRLRDLETGIPLQNSSVSAGRLRFIGGLLRIDSGGRLEVVGSASIDGSTTVTGTFVLTGSGWRIVGSGTIEGPTTVTGTLQVDGDTRITGNLGLEGDVALTGNMGIAAGGKFVAGDVLIEENKITVAGGDSPATLEDGALSFATGGKVEADDTNGGVRLVVGANKVYVGTGAVAIQLGGRAFVLTSSGFTFVGLDTIAKSETPENNPIGSLFVDAGGQPFRVVAG